MKEEKTIKPITIRFKKTQVNKIHQILGSLIIIGLLSNCAINLFPNKLTKKISDSDELVNQQTANLQADLDSYSNNKQLDSSNTSSIELNSADFVNKVSTQTIDTFKNLAKKNDPYASFKLGEMYLNGTGVDKDPTTAIQWFRKAAINGLPKAMLQLGNMYHTGVGEDYSLNKAIEWYKKAANLGNVKAMLILGEIYRGYGIAPDYNKSMYWYIKAAGMGSSEAEHQITRLITNDLIDPQQFSKNISSVINNLKKAAANNDPKALSALGDYCMHQLNHRVAIEYYNRAAAQGFTPALVRLGLLYLYGEALPKDYVLALEFFTKAASLGDVVAEYHLGEIYRNGLGVEKNLKLAVFWYSRAVKNNFSKALVKLADLYFTGKGVDPDISKAVDLYTKAATMGDSYAGLLLSIFYAKGIGVEQNLPKSVHWFNTVNIKKDNLIAKFDIAKAYEIGFGLKKNYQEAIKWYTIAAEDGLAKAQTKLAELYVDGLGVKQDYIQAINWYQKAAEQRYNYAEYSLGLLLQSDLSSKFNNSKAAYRFMKRAAISGYRPAQYSLALMLLQGNGTTANPIKAYSWLHIALSENGGYESNPELMDVIINKLEPEARSKAVLLVQHYRDQILNNAGE